MRVLFTTWAWPSHLFAMVPLAWACRAAGHEVRVASQPSLLKTIVATGLPAVATGYDVDAVRMVSSFVHPPNGHCPEAGSAAAAAPAQRPGGRPRALEMFLTLTEAMVDDLVALARSWRPDLVVYEPTAWAGPLAAAVSGVPAVRHLFGADLLYRAGDAVGELLAPLCRRFGVPELQPWGAVTVDPCPPGLQVSSACCRMPVRYVPYNGPGAVPDWLSDPPRRTRVCVTWGTTLSRLASGFFLARDVIAAIQELDVEILAAVSAEQRGLLGDVPPQVRVAESVPLHLVLPSCDLLIAHGGAGTMLTGLSCGLPQLLVPRLPDHAGHARQLARTGAGMVLPAEKASPEEIRRGAEELLSQGSYRAAARRLQLEIDRQPPPAEIVGTLAALI
jgi:UDP:flavonoid glycosyltransferase YjiC (YdhE family)